MVKSSKIQIKKDQMKILTELQNDSKVNVNVIVKNCGFSRQKVWRTITQMEKDKTIWGYTAIVDDERIGQKQFTLLIKRTHKPLEKKNYRKNRFDSIRRHRFTSWFYNRE